MNDHEKYWHSKYPTVNKDYAGRPLPGTKDRRYFMDIRHFIWGQDAFLHELAKKMIGSPDELALKAQNYVVDTITYTGDEVLGCSEYWMFPQETINLGKGDCEDGAILMASLLINALPSDHKWRVRVACGWVNSGPTAPQGGHAYCVYCRESDNEWVILDWCYYEDSDTPVEDKPMGSDRWRYKDVWFSFNDKYSWSHDSVIMEGRVKEA